MAKRKTKPAGKARCPEPPPAVASPVNELVVRVKPGETPEQAGAKMAAAGIVANASTVGDWRGTFPPVGITPLMEALTESADRAKRGELGEGEGLLMAQALALNALYTDLLHRARQSEWLDHFERYLRLGLKAQSQCRATLETLSAIKNPPTVFAKQANIAAGPQQVNNHAGRPADGPSVTVEAVPVARAEHGEAEPSRLLEAGRERLDFGAATATAEVDPQLAAVGVLDGTTNAGREGAVLAERVQGRCASTRPRVDARDPRVAGRTAGPRGVGQSAGRAGVIRCSRP